VQATNKRSVSSPPRGAVQRIVLCARIAIGNHAEFALKFRESLAIWAIRFGRWYRSVAVYALLLPAATTPLFCGMRWVELNAVHYRYFFPCFLAFFFALSGLVVGVLEWISVRIPALRD
jgi:hypothetical protein